MLQQRFREIAGIAHWTINFRDENWSSVTSRFTNFNGELQAITSGTHTGVAIAPIQSYRDLGYSIPWVVNQVWSISLVRSLDFGSTTCDWVNTATVGGKEVSERRARGSSTRIVHNKSQYRHRCSRVYHESQIRNDVLIESQIRNDDRVQPQPASLDGEYTFTQWSSIVSIPIHM